LPDVLAALKQHVAEDMAPGDASAHELLDELTIAWIAAERWRLEQLEAGAAALDDPGQVNML
jgi:hypothetical protein